MTTKPHRPAPAWALAALLSGTATLAPLAVGAEERIGIVLANRGDPVLIRDGEEQSVGRRDEIRAGDRLRTDERSRLQMRLEDGQTLSLTENTELHIEAYAFDEKSGTGESRKSLIEGGLRAITGQISGEGDYTIETEVATIGIRGTIFELAHGDGGTAGGTPRGRGFAENRGDERSRVNTGDDAPGDYFRVTDPDLPPEALSERPAELDALDEPAEAPADDAEETEDEAAAAPPGDEDTEPTEDGGALAAAEDESEDISETSSEDLSTTTETDRDALSGIDADTASARQEQEYEQTISDQEQTSPDADEPPVSEHDQLVDIDPRDDGVVPDPGSSFVFIQGDAEAADDPLFYRTPTLEEQEEMAEDGDWEFDADKHEEYRPQTGQWGNWSEIDSNGIGGFWIQGDAYVHEVDQELRLRRSPAEEGNWLGGAMLQNGALTDASVIISEDQSVTLERFQIQQSVPSDDELRLWETDPTETKLGELAEGIEVEGGIFILEERADDFTGDLAAMLSEADDIIELLGAFDFEADNNDWAVDGVFFLELDE
ncbi:FecR domain-containing protein [Halorhodospira sp. 9621]|uniref:FecR family protein n=1 Tax=Halorhodospira sp. 9621 TaxID=2899135 RepID=UPI001EE81C06|nr:FecR family protein [Halorhodospira sp. 9621]MCG5533992.1 FecR domain-containing protein [Halorhodospira sp. 9621]